MRREARAARGTSSPTTPEELGAEGVEKDSVRAREVTTFVSLGFCVNVCVWRQSCKVELCKCARVTIIFGCSSAFVLAFVYVHD